jgi:hypothetical protein
MLQATRSLLSLNDRIREKKNINRKAEGQRPKEHEGPNFSALSFLRAPYSCRKGLKSPLTGSRGQLTLRRLEAIMLWKVGKPFLKIRFAACRPGFFPERVVLGFAAPVIRHPFAVCKGKTGF